MNVVGTWCYTLDMLPPAELTANAGRAAGGKQISRRDPIGKSRVQVDYREYCRGQYLDDRRHRRPPQAIESCSIVLTAYVCRKRTYTDRERARGLDTRYRPTDWQNLATAAKPIVDALVDARIVTADNAKHMDCDGVHVREVRSFSDERIEIFIVERAPAMPAPAAPAAEQTSFLAPVCTWPRPEGGVCGAVAKRWRVTNATNHPNVCGTHKNVAVRKGFTVEELAKGNA